MNEIRKLDSAVKVDRAVEFVKNLGDSDELSLASFEEYSGVGISEMSEDTLREKIAEIVSAHSESIASKGRGAMGMVFAEVNAALPFADGKVKKAIVMSVAGWDKAVPKGDGKKKRKKKKAKQASEQREEEKKEDEQSEDLETAIDKWTQGRALAAARNSEGDLQLRKEGLLKEHGLSEDTFLTRFPPEPNGFLHIGHCKAMNFNFTLAAKKGGHCYLRFDDTNPAKEEQMYIESILDNVKWMGFTPWKVTHASDRFADLHRLAVKMIGIGRAYVCHQSKDAMEKERRAVRDAHEAVAKKQKTREDFTELGSPWRETGVEENLRKFELMRCGFYGEGEVCLRMKGDLWSDNPNMWDHVAYRIKYVTHPHVGDDWCIYPTYDFTHCIHDSLEWVSASCCTLEFENRRESYFWLLDTLDLYKPTVWEYSRLNLDFTVLSKRRLIKLVQGGFVRGWTDPRMPTIDGLRRRGYTAQILKDFCNRIGVTRNDNAISPMLLEHCARQRLDADCPRAFAILDPIKVIISNFDELSGGKESIEVESKDYPQRRDSPPSVRKSRMSRVVFIDRSDFRVSADPKKYFGMTVGKTVRLRYALNVQCESVKMNEHTGEVESVMVRADPESLHDVKGVRKGHLSWLSEANSMECEVRIYNLLFKVAQPSDDWIEQLNPESEVIIPSALVERSAVDADDTHFQFERVGYFVKDREDFTKDKPVFNRIVSLRESTSKKTMA